MRYTLMRWPSRIVTVGRRFRKRSSTRALDCETLAAAPWRYVSSARGVEADAGLRCAKPAMAPRRERHTEDLRVVAVDLIRAGRGPRPG